MSVLMEQHERWNEARERLWHPKPMRARRVFAPVLTPPPPPRVHHLFIAPIVQIDDAGREVVDESSRVPLWKQILRQVAAKHEVGTKEILSPRRDRYVVAARHECFWRCKNETTYSLPQIGRYFGGRDHTTVLHGIRKHEERIREQQANG